MIKIRIIHQDLIIYLIALPPTPVPHPQETTAIILICALPDLFLCSFVHISVSNEIYRFSGG